MSQRFFLSCVAMSLLAACVSCSRSSSMVKQPVRKDRLMLVGAGATFPEPLLKLWFLSYPKKGRVDLSYDAVSSGEGLRRFIGANKDLRQDQLVDFGVSDLAITDAEIADVDRGVQLIPLTAGAVALAYHLPTYVGELRLSRATYSEIMLGKIRDWNDQKIKADNPDAELPQLPITLVVRADTSGTTFAITNHLSAVSAEWRDRYGPYTLVRWPETSLNARGNEGVAEAIAATPGTLGYVHYVFARQHNLKMAALENKAGQFVAPTPENSAAAIAAAELPENMRMFFSDPEGSQSYPIITFSWALLYKDYRHPRVADGVRELFKWCLTDGQELSEELGYVRLPEKVVGQAVTALDNIEPKAKQEATAPGKETANAKERKPA